MKMFNILWEGFRSIFLPDNSLLYPDEDSQKINPERVEEMNKLHGSEFYDEDGEPNLIWQDNGYKLNFKSKVVVRNIQQHIKNISRWENKS